MKPFRDVPIRRKVTVVVLTTSAVVLLLTCTAFLSYEWVTFRRSTLRNLQTLGKVIAENCTATLLFDDPTDANNILATLRAEEPILSAGLYDAQGKLFASYASGFEPPPTLTSVPLAGHVFESDHLVVYIRVSQNGRYLGTLKLRSSLDAVQERFLLYAGLVFAVITGSSLIALGLSHLLQKGITAPISELAQTARSISANRDYSVRATRYGADEFGELTDSFNDMLVQIQQRDELLSASEERLRVALAAADMGTWRIDPQRNEETRDENLNRLLGLAPKRTTQSIDDFRMRVHPDDRPSVAETIRRALQDREPFLFECRIVRPDGSTRWVRSRGGVALGPEGNAAYIAGAVLDITDRKEAEDEVRRLNTELERRVIQRTAELARTNQDLEAFTYSVSHDLRGPLRHVISYAQILQEDYREGLSPEAVFYLNRIVRGTQRMSQLIDDLLNLGRVGRQPLTMQRTDLNRIFDEAIGELDTEIRHRRIEWRRDPLPPVKCDPGLMRLVFVNLLSNALKYSRPRELAIISIGVVEHDGANAIFVRDNGVGFDASYTSKLFGVFQRLHNSETFEGTGVGLATVERIIRNHGGRIWAEGETDKGATFYFTLPGL